MPKSVVGLERFDLGGHHHGASHDHSRIIRHSYHTPHYVELTRLAYDAWREVETASGETCIHTTGGIDLFPRGAAIDIHTYRQSMRSCDVDFDELTAADVMTRWPAWRLDADTHVLYQADTGIVSPATTVPLLQLMAANRGAVLHGNTIVAGIEPHSDDVRIVLSDGRVVHALNVVIAADAWTTPLVEPLGLKLPLTVTREQVTYYDTESPQLFEQGRFPVWIWMDDPSSTGSLCSAVPASRSPKIVAASRSTRIAGTSSPTRQSWSEPIASARRCSPATSGRQLRRRRVCTRFRPTATSSSTPCAPNIHLALGAGHGYKFVAWFGRTLAALARGADPGCDLNPFRLDRPALTDPSWQPTWLV